MQDKPTADELLHAIEQFLDSLVPQLEGSRSFHTRVAANTVRIVRRELAHEEDALAAEWDNLEAVLGPSPRPATLSGLRAGLRERNDSFCERIRAGDIDEAAAFAHVRATVRDKLRASNPALLDRSKPA